METIGKVHSLQSLGTVDGPGVRYIVFLQGCNLRCKCCHNPDTWEINGGKEYTPNQILSKLIRFREYFGKDGGLTFSGGEPLLQCDFVLEVFKLCKDYGIHTCIDTSGSIITDKVKEILKYTDYCLLDIKYSNDNLYREHVGCGIQKPLEFLELLQEYNIPTTLRQVTIPTINDTEDSVLYLKWLADTHKCVQKVELLPFRKICQIKYDNMGLTFPFGHLDTPTKESMDKLNKILK